MPSQGTYDPNSYVAANQATWPKPASGILYEPAMYWTLDPAGTFDGQPVAVGDRVYVTGTARRYGDLDYGDSFYGPPPDRNWYADQVSFRVWKLDAPPWDQPTTPYSGCPLGDRFPGWRMVVEAFYNADDTARTYGAGLYGDDVYGDALGAGRPLWNDVTPAAFSVISSRGGTDGSPRVPVDVLTVDVSDPDGRWFPLAAPQSWFAPSVGTPIRVGVLDPAQDYHPIAVGRIERIDDRHETPPRILTVEAFGMMSDLVVTIDSWQRPYETAVTRLVELQRRGRWHWGPIKQVPATPGPGVQLVEESTVEARAEMDRTALSAGWFLDDTVAGLLRYREWPLLPSGTALEVTDCNAAPGELLSPLMELMADTTECLPIVDVATVGAAETFVSVDDKVAIAQVGPRDRALGFPFLESSADPANVQAFAERVRDRYARIITRVASIDADTSVDADWLTELVDLDSGRPVTVRRRGLPAAPLELDAVVVGVEHRIEPNRWRATIYTSTITPTL